MSFLFFAIVAFAAEVCAAVEAFSDTRPDETKLRMIRIQLNSLRKELSSLEPDAQEVDETTADVTAAEASSDEASLLQSDIEVQRPVDPELLMEVTNATSSQSYWQLLGQEMAQEGAFHYLATRAGFWTGSCLNVGQSLLETFDSVAEAWVPIHKGGQFVGSPVRSPYFGTSPYNAKGYATSPSSYHESTISPTSTGHYAGLALIVVVALIWVAASQLIEPRPSASTDQSFDHPYFLTYFNTCGFSFWLLAPCCSRRQVTPEGEEPSRNGPSRIRKYGRMALFVSPAWLAANYLFNLSLDYTSVASNSMFSTTSNLWTMVFSVCFLGERLNPFHVLAVLFTMGGVPGGGLRSAMVATADANASTGEAVKSSWLGDSLALLSACVYGGYTVLLKHYIPEKEEALAMPTLFGCIGFLVLVCGWPLLILFDFIRWEEREFELPSRSVLGSLVLNALIGTNLSDVLWAYAVQLTTPLTEPRTVGRAATLGLSLTVPFGMISDALLRGKSFDLQYILGSLLVLVGFLLVSTAQQLWTYFCPPSTEQSCSSEESSDEWLTWRSNRVGTSTRSLRSVYACLSMLKVFRSRHGARPFAVMVDRTKYDAALVPELALRQIFGRQRLQEDLCRVVADRKLLTVEAFAMLGDTIAAVKESLKVIIADEALLGASPGERELALTSLAAVWKTCSTLQDHFAARRAKMEEDPSKVPEIPGDDHAEFREQFVARHPDVLLPHHREPHRKLVERLQRDFLVHGSVPFYEVGELRTRSEQIAQKSGLSKNAEDLLKGPTETTTCSWQPVEGAVFLPGYATGKPLAAGSLNTAKVHCEVLGDDCAGITLQPCRTTRVTSSQVGLYSTVIRESVSCDGAAETLTPRRWTSCFASAAWPDRPVEDTHWWRQVGRSLLTQELLSQTLQHFAHVVQVHLVEDALRADDATAYLDHLSGPFYDDLADWTFFLHADAPEHVHPFRLLEEVLSAARQGALDANFPFLYLSHNYLDLGTSVHTWDNFASPKLWRRLFSSSLAPPREAVKGYCCVQFLVPRNRALLRPKEWYANAFAYFASESSYFDLFPHGHFVTWQDLTCRAPAQLWMPWWHVVFGEELACPERHQDPRLPLFIQLRTEAFRG
eukprot:g13371.t2